MMRLLPAIGVLLLGSTYPLAAEPTKTQEYEAVGEKGSVDGTTQATDLRFKRDAYDRMTVPVLVGGYGPYRFLIDTGADRTAISSTLARQLRLEGRKDVKLHSVTGVSQIETTRVPMLDMTAKQVRNIDAALLEAENMGADGILGLDSLRSQRVLFDFKKQMLTVVPAEARVKEDRDTIVVTAKVRNGRLILSQASAEGTPVTLVVDTGAQVSIGNAALLRKLNRGSVKRTGPITLHSVTGDQLTGEYMIVRRLTIGGITLKDLPIVFADSHAFRRLGLDSKPALFLGMNALRGFDKVSIDFYRKKLKVVLPEEGALHMRAVALR
jgi:predicted aspartyl protease